MILVFVVSAIKPEPVRVWVTVFFETMCNKKVTATLCPSVSRANVIGSKRNVLESQNPTLGEF